MIWHVAQTRYHHERLIEEQCCNSGLHPYVPWVEEKRRWNERTAVVTVPLLSGFVFVAADCDLKPVCRMSGFLRWVMFNHQPGIVTEEEIQTMKTACHPQFHAHPEVNFAPGSIVLIVRGPFQGRTGVVLNQNAQFVRLRLGVGEIGGFSIQVPREDVE